VAFDGQRLVHIRSGKASHTFVAFNGGDRAAMPSSIGGDIGDKTYTKP
jgi:hypothetical protein